MTKQDALPTLLLIDDQSFTADLVRHALADQEDFRLHFLPQPEQALETALAVQPSVVLVDLKMQTMSGFEVLHKLRAHPELQQVPLILLSADDDPEVKAHAFASGANDYLVKWPDRRELAARLRYHASAYFAHRERDEAFRSLRHSQDELLLLTRQLAASQAALHQAQKLEAIGQLTGGVAHDFNNVLQIISGNLQLLGMMAGDDERLQQRITAAAAGVDRGARLASHLLAFARRQPLQSLVTDVGQVLNDMHDLLRSTLGERIVLDLQIADDLWHTFTDPCQLENAILNLVINAREAMSNGGTLTLRACNAGASGQVGVQSAGNLDKYVMIEIADTGSGMPPEVLERAFEPFFTTKQTGAGSGLGLSMAYGFVKQSGGHITLASEPGRGTSVRIFLPHSDRKLQLPSTLSDDASLQGAQTVLVVEDEAEVRDITVELLTSLGYRVLQAEDGASAMLVIESGVSIDLVFTDVLMPGPVRCVDLAERARQLHPGVQVLFASGYPEVLLGEEGGRLAADIHLLRKPYSADALSQKIRQLLRQAQPAAVMTTLVNGAPRGGSPAAAR